MVRTKADSTARKATAAKAPRKALVTSSPASGAGITSPSSSKYGGGNSVCPRPTPEWQKGIGGFLTKKVRNTEKENCQSEANKTVDDSSKTCDNSSEENASSAQAVEEVSDVKERKPVITDSDEDD